MGSTINSNTDTYSFFKKTMNLSNSVEDSEEYKKAEEEYYKLVADYDNLSTRQSQLYKELEQESYLPEEDKDAKDMIKLLGRRQYELLFREYTDRGEQIQKELSDIRKQLDALSNEENMGTKDLAEQLYTSQRHKAFKLEEQVFRSNANSFVDASLTSYPGFQLTTSSAYDNYLKTGEAKIVEMSPREYLERISYDIFPRRKGSYSQATSTMRNTLGGTVLKNILKYAKDMKKGVRYDMPMLDYKDNGQEGRHRALAAILNGYQRIPVLVRR